MNFVDIYLQGMRDRSMRSGTELAREIQLTDWPTAGNLSNRSSGVQISRDICTRLKRYLYSAEWSWIISIVSKQFRNISKLYKTWPFLFFFFSFFFLSLFILLLLLLLLFFLFFCFCFCFFFWGGGRGENRKGEVAEDSYLMFKVL